MQNTDGNCRACGYSRRCRSSCLNHRRKSDRDRKAMEGQRQEVQGILARQHQQQESETIRWSTLDTVERQEEKAIKAIDKAKGVL